MPDTEHIKLSEEDCDKNFTLIKNHLDLNSSWNGCAFETYGEELEFLKTQDPCQLWTMIEGDNDTYYLLSGVHLVNRICHLISKENVPENIEYEIKLD